MIPVSVCNFASFQLGKLLRDIYSLFVEIPVKAALVSSLFLSRLNFHSDHGIVSLLMLKLWITYVMGYLSEILFTIKKSMFNPNGYWEKMFRGIVNSSDLHTHSFFALCALGYSSRPEKYALCSILAHRQSDVQV